MSRTRLIEKANTWAEKIKPAVDRALDKGEPFFEVLVDGHRYVSLTTIDATGDNTLVYLTRAQATRLMSKLKRRRRPGAQETNCTEGEEDMKTILMILLLCACCGDVTNGIGPDGMLPDGGADGTADGNDTRDPDAMPPATTAIPGGMFWRSYDAVDYTDGTHVATVSSFRLDTYEVTVARFRAFLAAGKGVQGGPPAQAPGVRGWDSSWNALLADSTGTLTTALACGAQATWTTAAGSNEQKPINCVSWYEAQAFCIWDGGYLPSEVEWNYAEAGGDEQRVFPWSSPATSTAIDSTYASYNNGGGGGAIKSVGSYSPKGDGRWGQADLVGNVSEWTLDYLVDANTYVDPCTDCVQVNSASGVRIHRGGNFGSPMNLLRVGSRPARNPTERSVGQGFRCARPQ